MSSKKPSENKQFNQYIDLTDSQNELSSGSSIVNNEGATIQNLYNYFTVPKKVFIFLFLVLSSAGVLHFIHNILYDSLFSSAVWFDIAVFIFVGTISIMLIVSIVLFIALLFAKVFKLVKQSF